MKKRLPLLAVIILLPGLFLFDGARAQGNLPAPVPTAATPTVPLVTVTARADGCTVHVVAAGQTLWAIALAYGVKVDDIRGLNGMGANNATIYPGEKLAIRCVPQSPTAAPSLSVTPASEKPARTVRVTATPTRAVKQANKTLTLTAHTPSADQPANTGAPASIIVGLLVLAGGTLVVLLAFGLIRKR